MVRGESYKAMAGFATLWNISMETLIFGMDCDKNLSNCLLEHVTLF